jgi:NitT/TauT family transport system ATP-binding protein
VSPPTGTSRGISVALRDVSKTYRTRSGEVIRALAGVDTDFEAGGFFTIVGPSGCGKSTLMKLVAGLMPTSQGTIEIDNSPVDKPHPSAAVVFQQDLLLHWRKVLDNVLLPLEIKKGKDAEGVTRAKRLLEQVGLAGFEKKYPAELSGGMRQRVSICRALVQEPGLLLMDEPFGALDALTREQMQIDLQKLWAETGNTVLFITHSIDEAIYLSDRVLVLSNRPGRIELDLTIDLPRPRNYQTRAVERFVTYETQIR